MIKEDFSKRVIDYYDKEMNIQETINGMVGGGQGSSEYSFVYPDFRETFFWDEKQLSLEELFEHVEKYLRSQGINEGAYIIDSFSFILHYSGSDDIVSFCKVLESHYGLILDAITIAEKFDELKETKSILIQGDDSWKYKKDKHHSKVIHINNSREAEISHSIRINQYNYKQFKSLTKNKSLSKILNERTKIFALALYAYVGDIKKKRETVFQLLRYRGFKGSDRTISFKRLAPSVDKNDTINYEEYLLKMRQDFKLPYISY